MQNNSQPCSRTHNRRLLRKKNTKHTARSCHAALLRSDSNLCVWHRDLQGALLRRLMNATKIHATDEFNAAQLRRATVI